MSFNLGIGLIPAADFLWKVPRSSTWTFGACCQFGAKCPNASAVSMQCMIGFVRGCGLGRLVGSVRVASLTMCWRHKCWAVLVSCHLRANNNLWAYVCFFSFPCCYVDGGLVIAWALAMGSRVNRTDHCHNVHAGHNGHGVEKQCLGQQGVIFSVWIPIHTNTSMQAWQHTHTHMDTLPGTHSHRFTGVWFVVGVVICLVVVWLEWFASLVGQLVGYAWLFGWVMQCLCQDVLIARFYVKGAISQVVALVDTRCAPTHSTTHQTFPSQHTALQPHT